MFDHIMLSYQWNKQEFAQEVYDFLSKGGIPVWMDIQGGIKADLITCMSEGVERAAAVICFCTKDYQISDNCKTELKYAYDLKTKIIPVICDDKYTYRQTAGNEPDSAKWPCSWLGAGIAGKVYSRLACHGISRECPRADGLPQTLCSANRFIGLN